ncbi:hypothetical protein [Ornithinimicrobium kibberense]|uniref:hypothetical protein n=1 Tax=Ornithinimicrobium kibberense TaxID=282060 RepID=UPI0036137E48
MPTWDTHLRDRRQHITAAQAATLALERSRLARGFPFPAPSQLALRTETLMYVTARRPPLSGPPVGGRAVASFRPEWVTAGSCVRGPAGPPRHLRVGTSRLRRVEDVSHRLSAACRAPANDSPRLVLLRALLQDRHVSPTPPCEDLPHRISADLRRRCALTQCARVHSMCPSPFQTCRGAPGPDFRRRHAGWCD